MFPCASSTENKAEKKVIRIDTNQMIAPNINFANKDISKVIYIAVCQIFIVHSL